MIKWMLIVSLTLLSTVALAYHAAYLAILDIAQNYY